MKCIMTSGQSRKLQQFEYQWAKCINEMINLGGGKLRNPAESKKIMEKLCEVCLSILAKKYIHKLTNQLAFISTEVVFLYEGVKIFWLGLFQECIEYEISENQAKKTRPRPAPPRTPPAGSEKVFAGIRPELHLRGPKNLRRAPPGSTKRRCLVKAKANQGTRNEGGGFTFQLAKKLSIIFRHI